MRVQLRFSWLSCQHKATIPVTIDPKSKGTILNLFFKTGNHSDTISWSINTTTTGRDLVSYQYQSEAFNQWSQIKVDDPQPIY